MKANIDYGELESIADEVSAILGNAEEGAEPCLKSIGSVVSTEVVRVAPRSNNNFYWYKGNKVHNTHLANDVTYKVKKKNKKHNAYVSVSGGKKTWPKWILANDGHIAENGRFVSGTHFIEKAVKASEGSIDNIIDRYLEGVVK